MSSDWGIRVLDANAGSSTTNVVNADEADLSFSTKYNFLKQGLVGETSIILTGVGATGEVTISHNLGYVPYVEAFYKPSTAHDILSPTYSFFGSDFIDKVDYIEMHLEVTDSTIRIWGGRNDAFSSTGTSTITVPIYYLIYIDEL